MGAAHSRARPGVGPTKLTKSLKKQDGNDGGESGGECGYFILCLKMGEGRDRIKVVNASGPILKTISNMLGRHCVISKQGWDRHSAFSFKLQKPSSSTGRHCMISLTSEVLLTLYRLGWEPMTPIDLSVKGLENQTAICFRKLNSTCSTTPAGTPKIQNSRIPHIRITEERQASFENSDVYGSTNTINKYSAPIRVQSQDCLCLETYGKHYLGFHDVPNEVLFDLVQCVLSEWLPGVGGISASISSVVSDYSEEMMNLHVLHNNNILDNRRYMQLKGNPWSIGEEGADLEDALCAENLTLSLIACLARAQFKLQISINMDKATRVFFFIKDPQGCREVRLPTFCGVGLGEKDGLYVYRPTITRTQTSFFRSRNKGKSLRKKIRQSIRRKSTRRKKKDENAVTLAAAALAAAEKAEAEVEAVEIGVLESTRKERSTLRSGSSTSRKSKTSTVKFAIDGDMENLTIGESTNNYNQERKISSSSSVFLPSQPSTLLESG